MPINEVLLGPDGNAIHDSHPLPYDDYHLSLQALPPGMSKPWVLLLATKATGAQVTLQRNDNGVAIDTEHLHYFVPMGKDDYLHVITGDGDDTIVLNTENTSLIVLETGSGNDVITTTATARANLLVDAGAGDDRVTLKGGGEATLYGGDGNDNLQTAMDRTLAFAGHGDDIVICEGRTMVEALAGNNTVEYSQGRDRVHANVQTRIIQHTPPQAPSSSAHPGYASIRINGDDLYRTRVIGNLALLAETHCGRALLESLDASHAQITIVDVDALDNGYFIGGPGDPQVHDATAGDKILTGKIEFNPLAQRPDTPPVIILYHELCHAWNSINGTVLPEHENQVVGLPTPDSFDFDGDPTTPAANTNPDPFNENALRRELGLPRRNVY
ncbi:MAG: hypothetical protein LBJ33_13655 [Pseudomonas putida]|jgi:hypothetical protein|nr:hypothetical protein [Pseudomonas putida]